MATDKPRFSITLEPETLEKILAYKKSNHFSTQSKAIQQLIEIGICDVKSDKLSQSESSSNSVSLSSDEAELLVAYRELSDQGKQYLLQTADLARRVYMKKSNYSSDVDNVYDA